MLPKQTERPSEIHQNCLRKYNKNTIDNIGHQLTMHYHYDQSEESEFKFSQIKYQRKQISEQMESTPDENQIIKRMEDESVDELMDRVEGLNNLGKNKYQWDKQGSGSEAEDVKEISETMAHSKQKQQNVDQKKINSTKTLDISRFNHNLSSPRRNIILSKSPIRAKSPSQCSSLTKLSRKISNLGGLKSQDSQEVITLAGKQLEGDAKIIHKGKVIKTKFMLCKNLLAFIEVSFKIEELEKLKLLPAEDKKQTWIKIQTDSNPYLFCAGSSSNANIGSELPFYLFSSIITKKLSLDNYGPFFQSQIMNHQHIHSQFTFNSKIAGSIYKKSQYFGKWLNRFIVIKHSGIYSYRNSNSDEEHSFFIPQQSIKYIWTRFQIIYDTYLIIKIKHGIQKTQLAIPIMDFTINTRNWLYEMYRLLL